MGKKVIWILIAVAVGLLLFVYFSGRRAGKRGKDKKLPHNGSGIPEGWSPDGIVSQLHDELSGLDWRFISADGKYAVYGAMLALSVDQLTAVYNKFNQLYGKGSHGKYTETLTNWIEDDSWGEPNKTALLSYLRQNGLG